ncbi:hypothetical protein [Cupriavidus basilensis]|uniref:hypothetical protein n=1 Tax=Cupriavidus basilensis TaxID=68895 RepID=UPI003D331866
MVVATPAGVAIGIATGIGVITATGAVAGTKEKTAVGAEAEIKGRIAATSVGGIAVVTGEKSRAGIAAANAGVTEAIAVGGTGAATAVRDAAEIAARIDMPTRNADILKPLAPPRPERMPKVVYHRGSCAVLRAVGRLRGCVLLGHQVAKGVGGQHFLDHADAGRSDAARIVDRDGAAFRQRNPNDFAKVDLEASIIREMESFLPELGSGFTSVAWKKRIQIDGDLLKRKCGLKLGSNTRLIHTNRITE